MMNTIIRKKQSPITGLWSNILDQDFFAMPSYEHAVHTLPKVNVIEDDNGYKIELAVPGFEKNDFNIEIDDDVLSISLEKETNAKKRTSGGTWQCVREANRPHVGVVWRV